jgi:hypothetical protein
MSWSKERHERFCLLWERGDKPSDIASAMGMTIDAITSRARYYQLKPRRVEAYCAMSATPYTGQAATPWEVLPLPPDPCAEMTPDERRYAYWERARKGARELLGITPRVVHSPPDASRFLTRGDVQNAGSDLHEASA